MCKAVKDTNQILQESIISKPFPKVYSKTIYADILDGKRKAIIILKDKYAVTFRTLAAMLGDNVSVGMCKDFYETSKNK